MQSGIQKINVHYNLFNYSMIFKIHSVKKYFSFSNRVRLIAIQYVPTMWTKIRATDIYINNRK